MHERAPKLLADAIAAIEAATSFLQGANLEQYMANAMMRSAVERQLEILGEACSRLDKLDAEMSKAIPDIRLAIGLRNRIIHSYDAVDDAVVHETIQQDLQNLRLALQSALIAS
jgi:uncharacterized protein with HEPN domain